mgnify:CR=1 FL=1
MGGIYLIPLLLLGFLYYASVHITTSELFTYFTINFQLIFTSLLGVSIIISIREKRVVNILNEHLGIGDVLFFLILAVSLSPINFWIFYFGGISLFFIGSVIYNQFSKQQEKSLFPLAGSMGFLLMIALVTAEFYPAFQLHFDVVFI